MSQHVSKSFKKPSYHLKQNYAGALYAQSSSNPLNHISLDYPKEKHLITLPKESSFQSDLSKTSIKKLGMLLGPHNHNSQSLATQVLTNSTMGSFHKSPKSFFEYPKPGKSPSSNSGSSKFSLISPKDLVKKAISKLQSKENQKHEFVKSLSTKQNTSKSFSLQVNSCFGPSEKRNETSQTIPTGYEDPLFLSKSSSLNEKGEKLKRLKRIYDEELGLTRYHPHSTSEENLQRQKRFLGPSKSSTKLGYSNSASVSKPARSQSGVFSSMSEFERSKSAKQQQQPMPHQMQQQQQMPKQQQYEKPQERSMHSHKKGNSTGQIDLFTKEVKVMKSCENKMPESRKCTSTELSQKNQPVISHHQPLHHTTQQGERPDSPILHEEDVCFTTYEDAPFETEVTDDGALSVTNRDESKMTKIHASSVQTEGGKQAPKKNNYVASQQIHSDPDYQVKQAQSSMLEKLRDALGSTEFVRREDFESVLIERNKLEEEYYIIADENKKLRALFQQLQSTGWGNETDMELREVIIRQQKELEILRKREKAVSQIFQLVKKTEGDIDELFLTEEGGDDGYAHASSYNSVPENKGKNPKVLNLYAMSSEGKEKYSNQGIVLQTEASQDQSSQFDNDISQCTIDEVVETMPKIQIAPLKNPQASGANMKKSGVEAKSTADSSPMFSANLPSAHHLIKAKNGDKLNLDLTKVGVNAPIMKSNDYSSQSSSDKFNPLMIDGKNFTTNFQDDFEESNGSYPAAKALLSIKSLN